MNQQELFASYELDNSRWQALVLRFLGGSLALHLIIFLSAIYVPAMRDALYVAMLFDPDRKVVNKDYTLNEIADDVTVVKLANPSKFRYPEGYFNTQEFPADMNGFNDLSVVNGGDNGLQPLPPPTGFELTAPTPVPYVPPPPVVTMPPPAPVTGGLPPLPKPKKGAKLPPIKPANDAQAGASPTPKEGETANANVNKKPEEAKKPDANTTAQANPNEINRQPLIDFGQKVDKLQKEGKVDLKQPFAVTIEGELDKNGKLLQPRVTGKEGDATLTELAKELIAVLNASNVLINLSDITKDSPKKTHKVKFVVDQDQNDVIVNVELEFGDMTLAQRIQSGANAIVALTKTTRKDKIEGQLLQNVNVETNGTQVVFKSKMPRQAAEQLIQDQLTAAVKKADQTQE
jgi:hypothetical protein